MDDTARGCFILRKGNLFLMGASMEGGCKIPTWTQYKYDAWRTLNVFVARRLANQIGAEVCSFDPLNGNVY